MVPGKRLEHLVEKALDAQCDACLFHNTLDSDLSLYSDHNCGKDQIAFETLQVLEAHTDEVWFLQFSHRGKYLASSSKDQTAMVWEVSEDGQVKLKHRLSGHKKPVLSVSWSPDDKQLLTCGDEEAVRRWDISSGECLHVYEKSGGVGLISCGWFPDGKFIFTGLTDKSISLWGVDGKELESWKGQRTLKISDAVITGDGKRIISRCRENAILLLDREAKLERVIEEKHVITSFSLSKDSKFLLVNLINQEIHLWSLEDLKVVSKYVGHKRARFVIRSCFGGLKQAFIASGSEDSQVYIWHRDSGELLLTLPGHSGATNCVSWNPSNHHMLASASDDRTIRIWGSPHLNVKPKVKSNSNMHHLCNGKS
jgi:WD40 repeat protein